MTLRSRFSAVHVGLALLTLVVLSSPARADVHTVQVNEYYTQCDNGSTDVQYIELKPFQLNQFFRQCAQIEIRRTLAGPILFFAKPVFVGHLDGEVFATQKTFLIATAAFQTVTGITPDLIIPDGILDPAGGVIRFAADSGCTGINWGTIDLVAYGDQGIDPAPGPNQAAILSGFGLAFTLGTPTPTNFAGSTASPWTCSGAICTVVPTTFDFDTVTVLSLNDTTFTITNTGIDTLTGSVSEICAGYNIIGGGGAYALGPGDSRIVTLRFRPPSSGLFLCTIETGSPLCDDISCTGVGQDPPVCSVVPVAIDFGSVTQGQSRDSTFIITNTGAGALSGSVSESCGEFSIVAGGGPYSLAAGETLQVTVRFAPTTAGAKLCTVETGNVLCSDVDCSGNGAATGILPTRALVFDLQQNHPNPFNPVTQIRFSVPKDGTARLTIHDISGRLVRVIVNGWMPAGTYMKEWDARNDQGRAVASGVYFYRLEAGQNSVTRKAVLLK